MPAITTTTALKTALGISGLTEDAFLDQLLPEVEEAVFGWLGRNRVVGSSPFDSIEGTEYLDGTGRELLQLKRRPVTAIAGIWVDANGFYGRPSGAFGSATEWVDGTDFASRSLDKTEENHSLLVAIKNIDFNPQGSGLWTRGRGNIKATYTAGYVTYDSAGDPVGAPVDLVLGIHRLVAKVRQGRSRGGFLAGETIGRYTYRLLADANDLDAMLLRSTFNRYRETAL